MTTRHPRGNRNIELLIPERLAYWCELIDISDGARVALQAMAARVCTEPELNAAFEAFHEKTVLRGEWHREWSPLPVEPVVQKACGEHASLYYLLAYLSALPDAWAKYQQLGVRMEIFKATMRDLRFYMQDYFDLHGRWGYAKFDWIWRHLTVQLFRLGRLQYMLMPFEGGVRAFRHKGRPALRAPLPSLVLLADPDMPLRADGNAWGAGRPQGSEIPPENEETWRPFYESTDNGWNGHPVSPYGWVHEAAVRLSAAEWELVLQPGDTVLDLHIPRKDPLNAEVCGASYVQALEFFRRVFPDHSPKALYCHSWIFSPQLPQFLPPASNLINFEREFYKYPHPGTSGFLQTFVFGGSHDLESAPRDTSLRRAVLDWLAGGGEIFDLAGLMFHPPQEWGTQPYMRLVGV